MPSAVPSEPVRLRTGVIRNCVCLLEQEKIEYFSLLNNSVDPLSSIVLLRFVCLIFFFVSPLVVLILRQMIIYIWEGNDLSKESMTW